MRLRMTQEQIESTYTRTGHLMIIRVMATVLALICPSTSIGGPPQKIISGVLEDVPGHYAGQANFRGVRVLFQKNGNDWQPFRSQCPDQDCLRTITSEYPAQVTWTISFDGRDLGQVSARTPK